MPGSAGRRDTQWKTWASDRKFLLLVAPFVQEAPEEQEPVCKSYLPCVR